MKNRTTLEQDMYCMFPTGLTQLQILELVDYILAETDVAFSKGYATGKDMQRGLKLGTMEENRA